MNTPTILVVDDNPTNLKLACAVLESAGFHLLAAEDGEKALTLIESASPDLILMDLALPGMDGLTLTRQIKANPGTRHICVLALTAFAMKGDALKATQAGCDGYISKPIDTRLLPGQVAAYLLPPSPAFNAAAPVTKASVPVAVPASLNPITRAHSASK